jgi:hypothetical protein
MRQQGAVVSAHTAVPLVAVSGLAGLQILGGGFVTVVAAEVEVVVLDGSVRKVGTVVVMPL